VLVFFVYIATSLSSGPNGARVSFSSPEHGKQIHFPKRCFIGILEYRTMEKVQKPSDCVLHCNQNSFGSAGSGKQT
jgi:hypothetical protein